MFYENVYEAIGDTPMIKLFGKDYASVYLKLEFMNPGGSIKDRPALYMIEEGERQGLLKKNGVIIEATSGNMGIGLSMIGRAKGYKVVIVMPESMSLERQKLMKAYGAELLLTCAKDGMQGSVDLARKLARENGYFMPSQFENQGNTKAHYETTAVEILRDLDNKIDIFVSGIGTGGTISGVGKRLKETNNNMEIIGVEPESSPLLTQGKSGLHKIQGIGANFIPSILDESIIDKIETVSNEEAIKYTRILANEYGVLAGISSGANFAIACKLARNLTKGKNIVTVLPDSGERYLSTEVFNGE